MLKFCKTLLLTVVCVSCVYTTNLHSCEKLQFNWQKNEINYFNFNAVQNLERIAMGVDPSKENDSKNGDETGIVIAGTTKADNNSKRSIIILDDFSGHWSTEGNKKFYILNNAVYTVTHANTNEYKLKLLLRDRNDQTEPLTSVNRVVIDNAVGSSVFEGTELAAVLKYAALKYKLDVVLIENNTFNNTHIPDDIKNALSNPLKETIFISMKSNRYGNSPIGVKTTRAILTYDIFYKANTKKYDTIHSSNLKKDKNNKGEFYSKLEYQMTGQLIDDKKINSPDRVDALGFVLNSLDYIIRFDHLFPKQKTLIKDFNSLQASETKQAEDQQSSEDKQELLELFKCNTSSNVLLEMLNNNKQIKFDTETFIKVLENIKNNENNFHTKIMDNKKESKKILGKSQIKNIRNKNNKLSLEVNNGLKTKEQDKNNTNEKTLKNILSKDEYESLHKFIKSKVVQCIDEDNLDDSEYKNYIICFTS